MGSTGKTTTAEPADSEALRGFARILHNLCAASQGRPSPAPSIIDATRSHRSRAGAISENSA